MNNYKFTGYERDAESNLDNAQARYYSSSMGRFMSPDPYNAGADPMNPQSWNMYSYVNNNPLNSIDPSGLGCVYVNAATTEYAADTAADADCSYYDGWSGTYFAGEIEDVSQDTGNSLLVTWCPISSITACGQPAYLRKTDLALGYQIEHLTVLGSDGCDPSADPQHCGLTSGAATPSGITSPDVSLEPDARLILGLAGMESSRGLACAGKAFIANTVPFGGYLVGMGTAKTAVQDASILVATHPFTTSKALNSIELPNIGEALVNAEKIPGVLPFIKAVAKADPLIAAYGFGQDFAECTSTPQ